MHRSTFTTSRRRLLPATVALFLLTVPLGARSEEVAVSFTGVVTYSSDIYCQCLVDVEIGSTITGYYIYDSESVDIDPDTHVGLYPDSLPPSYVYVRVGRHRFVSNPGGNEFSITVSDSNMDSHGYHDGYVVHEHDAIEDSLHILVQNIYIQLRDNSMLAVVNDTLPLAAPNLADWVTQRSVDLIGDGWDWEIHGEVVTMTNGIATGVSDEEPSPAHPLLLRALPNPFNPNVTIEYSAGESGPVRLEVYDVSGRLVRTLVNGVRGARTPQFAVWDGRDEGGSRVGSGVYFCRLVTRSGIVSRKITLLK